MRSVYLVSLLLTLFCVGCDPVTHTNESVKPESPLVKVDNLWSNWADAIDGEDTLPKDSTQLKLMTAHLRTLGKITDDDVAKIRLAVPTMDEKHFSLTKSHSDAIRGIK